MDFRPINSDHSIQSAAFTITLNGMTPVAVVQSPKLRAELQAELPAVQVPEGLELSMAGSQAVPRRIPGIQFSHLRPDGTPAWALRVFGNELVVECTRYTRWQKVWEAARRYLSVPLHLLTSEEKPRKVVSIGQNIIDVFVANQEKSDVTQLLQTSDLLASKVFSPSPSWHSHVGWFEPSEKEESIWLNQLNVDAVQRPETDGPNRLHIQIGHNQEIRMKSPVSIPDLEDQLNVLMETLHHQNKRILKSLLSPAMQEKIGLNLGK